MYGISPKVFSRGSKISAALIKRTKSDLIVRRATREPLISQGPVGRQAWNGQTATVFGCTGFLGRYVVSYLATHGTRVVVPYRGIYENARHLRPTGDLGMIVPMVLHPSYSYIIIHPLLTFFA
ncbi:NADH dehydrogenase [ubiquinone] 1 alpha subcomplex subunit 9, mitochondrial [Smittium mucronatum]|uniref:NADH dehydrogenase [ubiquinone] 1 alpha subcomplex subunit 9, mitochondrial n=1 Tax=Smittium mucronatum TaxID=133383 RepID=A0A1R0H1M6_9FUNG|nr:NADH dehydrogenase [ubiquinone] 1 alpha subcomplex subunit 9, mitochondrial [Smittium mucronatum]